MDVPFPYSDPIQIISDNDYLKQGAVSAPLQKLDEELEEHDTSLALEIAEDTYAALLNNRPREDKVTVYTSKSLHDIQKDMPGSTFWKINDYDKDLYYDMSDEDGFIRVRFEDEHAETVPIDTSYENISFSLPTFDAFEDKMHERGYR